MIEWSACWQGPLEETPLKSVRTGGGLRSFSFLMYLLALKQRQDWRVETVFFPLSLWCSCHMQHMLWAWTHCFMASGIVAIHLFWRRVSGSPTVRWCTMKLNNVTECSVVFLFVQTTLVMNVIYYMWSASSLGRQKVHSHMLSCRGSLQLIQTILYCVHSITNLSKKKPFQFLKSWRISHKKQTWI